MSEFHHPRDAQRVPAPHLEQWAENQRPKHSGWFELRLMQLEGTNIYQWWGREALAVGRERTGSAFWDQASEPFVITPNTAALNPEKTHAPD